MSSPDIAAILEKSKELDQLRKDQEDVLVEINKMHKKLQAMFQIFLLNQLDTLLPSGPQGQPRRRIEGNEQKRKRMKSDSEIARLSPASLKGEQVAARDTREFEVLDEEPGDDEGGHWPKKVQVTYATVVNGHRKRKTDDYLLEFDDDEEDGSLPQRTVPFHKVVALPEGHRQ
ncbi:hypothetical protein M0R45_005734 [Rubus argutus]|uniref:SGF29 C-terminal domain-containing protein n=1 Tax=Rubus argutus TaxID=59490 RepID=A0AAW1YNF0_RUBAR